MVPDVAVGDNFRRQAPDVASARTVCVHPVGMSDRIGRLVAIGSRSSARLDAMVGLGGSCPREVSPWATLVTKRTRNAVRWSPRATNRPKGIRACHGDCDGTATPARLVLCHPARASRHEPAPSRAVRVRTPGPEAAGVARRRPAWPGGGSARRRRGEGQPARRGSAGAARVSRRGPAPRPPAPWPHRPPTPRSRPAARSRRATYRSRRRHVCRRPSRG